MSDRKAREDLPSGRETVRLLIADDHRLFLAGLRQILKKQPGIEIVDEAVSGLETVAKVAEHRPDVVLLDVSMPELNGIEVTRRIQEETPATRVVILSMHADRRYVTEAIRAGARGYLIKNCRPHELLRAIHVVMDGRFYLGEGIEQILAEYVQTAGTSGDSAFGVLSAREREVLQLLAEGKTTKQIGDLLILSVKTVETHRQHIMEKLNLHSIVELTRYAIREGLTPLD